MAKEKVRLWDRLKYKYKLSVINETSYEEVFNFRLSQLHVLTALSVLAVILVVLTILLIAFTGLREFIPGYPDGNMRQMIAQNALRVDSLENELLKRDRFFKSIRLVLNGGDTTSLERSREDTARYRNDTIRFQISEQENEFRAAIEERERFNLSLGMKEQNHDYYHFFPPVEGIVTQSFDEKKRHYGTDIVAKANAKVAAVLDGVVIFTDWTVKTGRWTHIAVTYDSDTHEVNVYIDGVKKTPQTFARFADAVDWGRYYATETETQRSFWIGYSYEDARYLDGDISEVRVWNKVLAEEDINGKNHFYKLYDPELNGNLVAYWKFNEGGGATVGDYSQYGNDAAATKVLTWNAVELPAK